MTAVIVLSAYSLSSKMESAIPVPPMAEVPTPQRPFRGELHKAQMQFLYQERQRQEDSLRETVAPSKRLVEGSDNEGEADDLSFLADFPTPLTMRQRNDLMRHTDTVERNYTRIKRAYDVLDKQVSAARSKKAACDRRLAELASGVVVPVASGASLAPALGVKREREEASPKSPESVPAASSVPAAPIAAVSKRPQIGMKSRVGLTAPRGGLGALRGALATIQKESQATIDLQQQRQAVRNKAEQDALHQELRDIGPVLAADEVSHADLQDKLDAITSVYETLSSLLVRMDEEETLYAAAFSLTASGSWTPSEDAPCWVGALSKVGLGNALPGEHVHRSADQQEVDRLSRFGANSESDAAKLAEHVNALQVVTSVQKLKNTWCGAQHSIPFTLAQNTDDTRMQLVSQIEKALPRYLAFRDEADPHLVEIDQIRAEREERQRQQIPEDDAEEEPYWSTDAGVHPLLDLEALSHQHGTPAPQQGILPLPEPECGSILEDAPFDY